MRNTIIRFAKVGEKMCPIIAEEAGLEVNVGGLGGPAKEFEYAFRWGFCGGIPNGPKIVNKEPAILETCNKAKFRKKLADAGLAPKTALSIKEFRNEQFFPVIIRPAEHQRSENIYVAKDAWDIMETLPKVGNEFYISEKIEKVKEFRVMVVSGRIVWMIEKIPEDKGAISWGCVREGDFEYVGWDEWPKAVVENALRSFELSELDFGAIDIIVDKNWKAYALEINTAPFLTRYYAKTIGKAFKYIVENGRDRFPVHPFKGWRDAIHPAVSKEAKV